MCTPSFKSSAANTGSVEGVQLEKIKQESAISQCRQGVLWNSGAPANDVGELDERARLLLHTDVERDQRKLCLQFSHESRRSRSHRADDKHRRDDLGEQLENEPCGRKVLSTQRV